MVIKIISYGYKKIRGRFDVIVYKPGSQRKSETVRRKVIAVLNDRVITAPIETNDRHGWYLSKEEIFIFNKRGRVLYNLDKLPKLMKNFCWSYRFDEVKDVILTSNILITFGIK